MLVELDVFSGRPNPRWRLDANDQAWLRARLATLAPSAEALAPPPDLGYRGFAWSDAGGLYRARLGRVETPFGPRRDPGCAIERFLLDRLPTQAAPLRQRLLSALDAAR